MKTFTRFYDKHGKPIHYGDTVGITLRPNCPTVSTAEAIPDSPTGWRIKVSYPNASAYCHFDDICNPVIRVCEVLD